MIIITVIGDYYSIGHDHSDDGSQSQYSDWSWSSLWWSLSHIDSDQYNGYYHILYHESYIMIITAIDHYHSIDHDYHPCDSH